MSNIITSNVNIVNGYWGIWHHAFQTRNTQWLSIFEARIFSGNFFLGLQAHSTHIFDAQIPPKAKIVSAIQRVQAFQNSGNLAYNLPLSTFDREQHFGLPLLRPFEPFEGWRIANWDNNDVQLLDNTLGTIIETSGGVNNTGWIIRQITAPGATLANRQRMAQKFVMPAVGNTTIGRCIWQMYRVGNPTGSVRVRVHPVALDKGVEIPDESVTLATSDDVLASTIPTAPTTGNPINFLFTGGDQVSLTPGVTYAFVIDVDYAANNADYVVVRAQRQFFTTGLSMHFGEGLGLDWQNFPGSADINQNHSPPFEIAPDVIWSVPQFLTNGFYDSPDISSLVQAQVDAPWYHIDAGIIINQQAPANNQNRVWRSAQSPNMPRLIVTYELPNLGGGGGKGHGAVVLESQPEDQRKSRTERRKELAKLTGTAVAVIESEYF